jgi:hypothetical protein
MSFSKCALIAAMPAIIKGVGKICIYLKKSFCGAFYSIGISPPITYINFDAYEFWRGIIHFCYELVWTI